jgi:DNA repair protein RadD
VIQLRDYQQEAKEGIFDYFRRGGRGNPLVVAPTGSGKSVIIADFLRETMQRWENQRIVVVSHVKEILEQNTLKLLHVWPGAPIGIYSASMGSKRVAPITIAQIQTAHRAIAQLGRIDLAIVDEAHLVPKKGEGQYRSFLKGLREVNWNLRVVGFTATPVSAGSRPSP